MQLWISLKGLLENFWVFQAFQIPIVLFIIILLTFAAGRINSADFTATGQVFEKRQLFFLQWIGYGFAVHFVYLGINLHNHLLIFDFPEKAKRALDIGSDILCAVIFVAASFHWFFTGKIEQYKDYPVEVKRYKKVWKLLSICYGLMTVLICTRNYILIFIKQNNLGNFSLEFFFFALLSYFATGYCLFESMKASHNDAKAFTGRHFVLYGFAIWAVLQLWMPISEILSIHKNKRDLVGFAFSTAIKLTILYGFFIYFIGKARSAIILKNKHLQDNTTSLERLQDYIKEMSSATSMKNINNLLARHLVQLNLFQFEYVRFSRIDYLSQKIVHFTGSPVSEEMAFDSDCTEAKTIREVKPQLISSTLNNRKGYRLYIPVINYERHKVHADTGSRRTNIKIIGVLEIAYTGTEQSAEMKESGSMRKLLDIYVDNFAQTFDRLSQIDIHDNILSNLEYCDNHSGDNENMYLSLLLDETCQYVHADAGFIRILSFNEPANLFTQKAAYVRDDMPVEQWRFAGCNEDMMKACCADGECKFNNDTKYAEAVVPIKYEGLVIGYMELASAKPDFFNDQNIYALNRIIKDVGRFYVSKKFHNAVTTLTYDNADLFNMESIFQPAVQCIQQYFLCNQVSIWSQEYASDVPVCVRSVTGGPTKEGKPDVSDIENGVLRKRIPSYEPIDLNTDEPTGENQISWKFGKTHGIETLIHVPLMIDTQQYGFINLYSKRKIDRLFAEDIQILKLIGNKCVISLVVSEIVRSFSNITQSLVNKDPEDVMKDITLIANRILHSDPVVLFLLDEEHNIKYEKTIYSGYIAQEQKIYEGRKSNFLEATLRIGEDKFYNAEPELPDNFNKETSFWRREKIRSLAAIPLKHDGNFIGAMYFNYRREYSFTELVKKMIKTFSSLATSAIINAGHVNQVGKNYAKTLDTLERMLPAANASALADIVRAVNHDIRHSLTGISQNLLDIKNNIIDKKITEQTRKDLMANIEIVKNNINNATELIRLFDPSSFSISHTDLYTIACDVTKIFTGSRQRTENGINVTLHKPKQSLESIRCVRAELSMIIFNLITNAKNAIVEKWIKNGKHTPNPEGNIHIRVGYADNERLHTLEVEDDGTGIDNHHKARIYEHGFSTRINGLGIGLFFIKETLAKSYLGTIDCHTVVGDGATFKLKFKQHIN